MSKSTALALTPEIQGAFQPAVLEVIRTSLCPTATDPEFLLFAHKAASYGLDPFKNEIFFIKYGNQARIQFAAAAYLSKAREKEGFQPPDTQIVCEHDVFKARKKKDENGKDDWEIIEHEVSFPRGKIIGAYSISYRDGYRPVTVFVEKEHIAHVYTGQNKDNWNKWEPDMIGKFAEQRGLSKQYGLEFGDDDIPRNETAPDPYVRKDITAESNATTTQPTTDQLKKTTPAESIANEVDELWKVVGENLGKLGHSTKTAKAKYLQENFKIKGESATADELKKLIQVIEMEIAEFQSAADELE